MANGLLQYGDPGYIPSAEDIENTPGVSVGPMPLAPPTPAPSPRQMQNRQAGVLTAQRQPNVGLQQAQSPFAMPLDQMNQLYGIMAAYSDDPTQVGQGYVSAMQQRQVIERQNQPIEQFLRLYGNVNPFDWSAPSLQRFHDNYIKTGQLQFDLLEPKKSLSEKENAAILDADEKMFKAGREIGNIGSLIERLDAANRAGNYSVGIFGTVDEWFTQNITGDPDDTEMIKQNYRDLKNKIVIQGLPPGVASDRDIAIAREGWPGPNVSPAYLAAFLRGVQKLEVLNYAYNMHKSMHIGQAQELNQLTSAWQRNGRMFFDDALAANGLQFYNPRNPDGSQMSMQQAAEHFYRREGMGAQPSVVPMGTPAPSPTTQPQSGMPLDPRTGQPFTSQAEMTNYYLSLPGTM